MVAEGARAGGETGGGTRGAGSCTFSPKLVTGGGRPRVLSRLFPGSLATGSKLRKSRAFAALLAPRPAPRPLLLDGGGGGAARLPRRRALFVVGGVFARRHGEHTAIGPVQLAVAARAAAAGEGSGALQKFQLSDCEERR